jgi:hypothetical protein
VRIAVLNLPERLVLAFATGFGLPSMKNWMVSLDEKALPLMVIWEPAITFRFGV